MGGKDKALRMVFKKASNHNTQLSFWAQRWTKTAPFDFKVVAETPGGDVTLATPTNIRTGNYNAQIIAEIPAGTTAVRLVTNTAEKGGLLVDDIEYFDGPMVVTAGTLDVRDAYPLLKRAPINTVMSYTLKTKGVINPIAVESLQLRITPADAIEEVTLRTSNYNRSIDGTDGPKFSKSIVYGKAKPAADGTVTISCSGNLTAGENVLWVDAKPAAHTKVGSTVTFESLGLKAGGKVYGDKSAPVTQRIGYLVAVPDAKVANPKRNGELRDCKTYRIPGLIRTQSGALLGCFDARYENHLDLSSDIDVAVVRSEDGGQTWTEPSVAMDAGPGKGHGCGDPCILQDTTTGRIWIQALATHFDRNPCLLRSRDGFDLEDTGQWEMVYSADDGKTWSKHINVTTQIKKHEWTTILAGPGCGICTGKGVLVFPAQIWQSGANPFGCSTICYSEDGGLTWTYGTGVPKFTSECQVVELQDGSLMLSCRNETAQGKRAVYITKDMGKTWEEHSTHTKVLNDPACQASLIAYNHPKLGRILLYSHPNSRPRKRNTMTVRISLDDGKTWNDGYEYDCRECWGYSCLAMVDDDTVGLFYEPAHVSETNDYHGIGFLRIPLSDIINAGTAKK